MEEGPWNGSTGYEWLLLVVRFVVSGECMAVCVQVFQWRD